MTANFIAGYWGKAHASCDTGPRWHPLAFHCLDVAAVTDRLLACSPRRLQRLAELTAADTRALQRFLVLLVALHDVGKFSSQFQAKSAEGPRRQLPAPPPGIRHDAIGHGLLDIEWTGIGSVLSSHFAEPNQWTYCAPNLWTAVTGHHGQPATDPGPHWRVGFADAERADLAAFVAALGALLPPIGSPLPNFEACAPVLSWHLAGLTNVSDWIGSNQTWFPYSDPCDLDTYWKSAQEHAATAIAECGVLPSASPASVSAAHLLPHLAEDALSPLQKTACDCALPEGPMLAIVEDVTGAGKTEAALILAARLMAARRASGLFFALPTMATANAMYSRLRDSYRRLFEADASPSLVLAHGKRGLHEGFRLSILEPSRSLAATENRTDDESVVTPADLSASAACAAWLADDRRKVFLADVGVGTVDQALLGVLPSRFQSLRLWGLSDRVLIVDEAHSFDSYLSRELETLLEFHAALGGSAIVLSATLTTATRSLLTVAFERGLGKRKARTSPPNATATEAYPLLTLASADGITTRPVAPRPGIARELNVRRIATEAEAVTHALAMSRRGATVAWIRNTVDDTISAYEKIKAHGLQPILLHARFAMGDRLRIEANVQDWLGKSSDIAGRRTADGVGRMLIGSQILEQSLDYDVDAMISDLAPVDMLIQRAGRLWRHPWRTGRPIGSDERELVLLSPNPGGEIGRDWYRDLSKGAAAVYPDHGFVWLTARALAGSSGKGSIRTPEGIRSLLAAVYGDAAQADIPKGLERAARDAQGKRMAMRSIAAGNSLEVQRGYLGNNQLWMSDTVTPTRLGEPVTVFRLARRENGRIVPWFSPAECDGSLARAWAMSECLVAQRKASNVPEPSQHIAREVAETKATWSTWEQNQPLLLLEKDAEDVWRGRVLAPDGTPRDVLYDSTVGWCMPSP